MSLQKYLYFLSLLILLFFMYIFFVSPDLFAEPFYYNLLFLIGLPVFIYFLFMNIKFIFLKIKQINQSSPNSPTITPIIPMNPKVDNQKSLNYDFPMFKKPTTSWEYFRLIFTLILLFWICTPIFIIFLFLLFFRISIAYCKEYHDNHWPWYYVYCFLLASFCAFSIKMAISIFLFAIIYGHL